MAAIVDTEREMALSWAEDYMEDAKASLQRALDACNAFHIEQAIEATEDAWDTLGDAERKYEEIE